MIIDFIDVKGWKANGNKLGGFSRMSGFKLNEAEIEDKVEVNAKTEDKIVPETTEEKVSPEVSKEDNGDELSLF